MVRRRCPQVERRRAYDDVMYTNSGARETPVRRYLYIF